MEIVNDFSQTLQKSKNVVLKLGKTFFKSS